MTSPTLSNKIADAGVTQRAAAAALDVSLVAMNNWATGRQSVPPARARQLEKFLGLEPGDLDAYATVKPQTQRTTAPGWSEGDDGRRTWLD